MFLKLAFNNSMTAVNSSVLIRALLKHHKQINNLTDILAIDGLPQVTKDTISLAGSEFVKGVAIDSIVEDLGTSPSTGLQISLPCVNSTKRKKCIITYGDQAAIGWKVANNDHTYESEALYINNTLASPSSSVLILSMSDRHIFVSFGVRCFGMFEFVANDGFYTETSKFVPVMATDILSDSLVSSGYCFGRSQGYVNPLTNVIVPGGSLANTYMGWETPFGASLASPVLPRTNACYDFVSDNTEKTPILIPFGAQRRQDGFIGGSISELCDVYIGPMDIAGVHETVVVGDEEYCPVLIGLGSPSNSVMFYIPKW